MKELNEGTTAKKSEEGGYGANKILIFSSV